ncbi:MULTISPECIES: cytochrome b [Caballeronia]|uniref:Cytochrome B561 n=1 Tax=Caballeronia zhejiangensis TaxID=871203 RepID=A0A656QA36_9BURK|nr:cytochrome b [Caballeronia zhejiangensis]EKS71928.1 putative cytochrome B561 [Burkholderia sp. SJ98]KDR26266.1 cytochrome B561 [Caballeronia zhejiangensis]
MVENHLQSYVYSPVARTLHWLIAGLTLAQFIIGWTMPDVHHDTLPTGEIAWHLRVGAVIVAVMVVRIIWRITHAPKPAELSPQLRFASNVTHWLLYALLVAVPLAGWANASARGWMVNLLGVLPYPALAPKGSSAGMALGDVHSVLAWVLLAVIALHIAAALFHRFVFRDSVLRRML